MENKYYNEYAEFYDLDYSKLTPAAEAGYVDPDGEFYIGESGGFIFKMPTFINTNLFSASAKHFKEFGKYTLHEGDPYNPLHLNSVEYNNFWKEEERRRKEGFTLPCQLIDGKIENLRITGKHYGFLNYARILRVPQSVLDMAVKTGEIPASAIRKEVDFPQFFGGQYMWFKVKEFSKRNGFHLIVGKSRRAGFSYVEAYDAADEINLYPKTTVILGAYDKKYLTQGDATSKMASNYIQFFEENTNFIRYIAKNDTESEIQLGYKEQGSKFISGYKSKILVITFGNNPDAAIGKDASLIKLEELSNFPNFNEMADVTEPTTRAGKFLVGQITGYGTGGSDDAKWEVFSQNFYNPFGYKFMPFENIWESKRRHKCCGYWKSYLLDLEPYIDQHGNSLLYKTKEVTDQEDIENKKSKSPAKYIKWRSQYARTPGEAFADNEDNIYSSPELNDHIKLVEDKVPYWADGDIIRSVINTDEGLRSVLKFYTNDEIKVLFPDRKTHPHINEVPFKVDSDINGCIRIFKHPIKVNGVIPDKLYRAWHDPYGIDKDLKTVNKGNSLGCTYIFERTHNLDGSYGEILVATFVGRRSTMDEYNKIMANLMEYYNAKLLFENDRGQVVADFKKWKKLSWLVGEPQFEYEKELQGKSNREYGISMGAVGGKRVLRGHTYLRDWLYEVVGKTENDVPIYRLQTIDDLQLLKEFQKFYFGGNFDRISTMLIGMYDIKEEDIKPFVNKNKNSKRAEFFKR